MELPQASMSALSSSGTLRESQLRNGSDLAVPLENKGQSMCY